MLRRSTVLRILTGLLLAIALLAGLPSHGGKSSRVYYAPHPEAKNAPRLQGQTWEQEGELYRIRLQKLDEEERQAYVKRMVGLASDPFANKPGQDPRFFSFLLEVENRGDGSIDINPFNCWLMPTNGEVRNPIGLTDLSFSYHMAGADLPPAYEKVGDIIIDKPDVIQAGRTVHGLLVYRAFEKMPRKFHVDVQLTLPDGNLARFRAPYRRVVEPVDDRKP